MWIETENFELVISTKQGKQWNYKRNIYYKKCLEIDVNEVCDTKESKGLSKFENWVRVHVILEHVKKLSFL